MNLYIKMNCELSIKVHVPSLLKNYITNFLWKLRDPNLKSISKSMQSRDFDLSPKIIYHPSLFTILYFPKEFWRNFLKYLNKWIQVFFYSFIIFPFFAFSYLSFFSISLLTPEHISLLFSLALYCWFNLI